MTMITDEKQKYMEKVRKLLALAGNNPSMEEAQAAMLQAQRLMAKYNIVVSDVQDAKPADRTKDIVEGHTFIKEILWWKKRLHYIIAGNFRCFSTVTRGSSLNFIGMEEDVEVASMVYAFAEISVIYLSKKYVKENVRKGERIYAVPLKNAYIEGYLAGIREALQQQVEADQSVALVVVKDDALVRYYNGLALRAGKPSKQVTRHDPEAVAAGYEDGRNFDHTKKQLSGEYDDPE